MRHTDFQINSMVKSIFIKHWIDLQKVKFGTYRGSVRLRGTIRQLGSRNQGIDASFLEALFSEVRSIPGVKRVYFLDVTFEKESA